MDDAPRPDVQMADFAIPHLAFGQADVRPGGVNQRIWELAHQFVVVRLPRESNGVALNLGPVAPAVEHGQNDRLGLLRHSASGYPESVRQRAQPTSSAVYCQ